ncbi:uncharacterized protein LOC123868465 [Maniola jurtina]|uniref:uncharacterized protein LOC123868465 n=1 Tax=Maniola jurtina TaxID=191418 RepID=UPI001E689523|nr:uncharacterized protein LOC123868465 [Maniola jurtina]
MHKNSQHSARDSEIVRVSVSLPIAATLYLLTRAAPRSPTTILSGGTAHVSRGCSTLTDPSAFASLAPDPTPSMRTGSPPRSTMATEARTSLRETVCSGAVVRRRKRRRSRRVAARAHPRRVLAAVCAARHSEARALCTAPRCAYFRREEAPGRVGRVARALAAVLWWWCVALLRLVALCAPPPGPSGAGAPPPPARAAEDAPAAASAACAGAPANSTDPPPPTPSPEPPDHTGWWWAGACVGGAVLLCAAGALARPHLRRRAAPNAATNPMLSVQVPGCAGMERLGAPGGPRLRHDHRHHHSTLEWEKQQRLQAMVGRLQEMVEQETRARSAAAAERLGLPPSIQLPDGEYGQDAHLQLRVPYQQAELTRSSFQPPPNKCVSDVPEWAGAADARRAQGGGGAGGGKKDGLLQKATRWWVRMGARPPPAFLPAAPPPCVMVPRRAAPSPPPDA